MASPMIKRFSEPDEERNPSHGLIETVKLGPVTASRVTLEPGWRWLYDMKQDAGTELCESEHTLYAFAGRLHVALAGGEEFDIEAGEVAVIPPSHDAWVAGDQPFIAIDFGDLVQRAELAAEARRERRETYQPAPF